MAEKAPNCSLAGKVAIISGASSGIGAAIAAELSSRGAFVVINYRSPVERAEATRVQAALAHPENSLLAGADLSLPDGPGKLVQQAVDRFNKVDILVNNAANMTTVPLSEITVQDWEAVMHVNSRGLVFLTQAVLPHLSRTNSRIINISSSTSCDPPGSGFSLYTGSKGMIDSLTRCWARELPREYGCTVNAVAPGMVGTEAFLNGPPMLTKISEEVSKLTPVAPRMAKPEEIAWSVAMLCEEGASWINGSRLVVAGGANLF